MNQLGLDLSVGLDSFAQQPHLSFAKTCRSPKPNPASLSSPQHVNLPLLIFESQMLSLRIIKLMEFWRMTGIYRKRHRCSNDGSGLHPSRSSLTQLADQRWNIHLIPNVAAETRNCSPGRRISV